MSINHKNIILTALVCAALSGSAAVALAAADATAIDAAESAAQPQAANLHDLPLHWDSVEHPLQNKETAKQAKAMPIIITAEDVKKAEKAAAKKAKDEQQQAAKPAAPQPAPSVAPAPVTPPIAPPTIAPPQDNWVTPKAPVAPKTPPAEQAKPVQESTPTQSLEITPLEPQVAPAAPSVELPAVMPLPSAPATPQKEIIVELPEIMPLTAEQLAAPQIEQPVPPKTIKKTVELPPVELFGTSRTVEIEVAAVEEEPAPVAEPATKAKSTVELQLQPLN